jgi:phosphoribosylamine-glycine ligase
VCLAACAGKLDEKTSEWDDRASLGVVVAAGGYPVSGSPKRQLNSMTFGLPCLSIIRPAYRKPV